MLNIEQLQLTAAMLLDSAIAERARHDNMDSFHEFANIIQRLNLMYHTIAGHENQVIANYAIACRELAQPVAQMQPWLRALVIACQVNRPIPDAKFAEGDRVVYGDETEVRTVEELRFNIVVSSKGSVSNSGWGYYLSDPNGGMGPVEEYRLNLAPPETKPEPPLRISHRRRGSSAGFVYLVNEVNGPHYKIGRSKNPDNRTATFGVKLPYRVEYECVIQTPDMYALESELHARFADKRADGEWFALTPADVDYVKSLAGEI